MNYLVDIKRFIRLVIVFAGFVTFSVCASASTPDFVQEIVVRGNTGVNVENILFMIKVTKGARLDPKLIRRDVETLYESALFDEVKVDVEELPDGYRLIYSVTERPIISDVVITGSRAIGLNTLREELTVATGERYDPVKTRESMSKLEEKYRQKGYHFVVVTPRLTGAQPGIASLIFDIDEGTKLRIRDITITGNENLNTGNRMWGLKSQLKNNQEWWWFSFISDAGIYKEQLLSDDIKAIEKYYKDRGYLRVAVSEPKVTLNRPDDPGETATLSIAIDINEGEVYKLNKIDVVVTDPEVIPREVIQKLVDSVRLESYQKYFGGSAFFGAGPRFETGKRYSLALEDEAIKSISDLYGTIGYIYVYIDPQKVVDDNARTIDITFNVVEGKQAFLHRLEFVGNFRTKDRVLRRNFTIAEGDIFNIAQIKSSISRIDYLSYIDEVVPDIQPLSDSSKVDVIISLADNRQTEIQLSGGYSGYNKLYGTLGLSEHNLFGKGQEFNISATSGSRSETFRFSFSDEWIMDRPYYGSISLWNSREDFDYSTQRKLGGSLFGGRALGRYFSTRLGYTLERNKVFDISENADEAVKELEGTQLTSSLTHMWIFNSLNNRLDPTDGFYASASFQIAGGFLGGDNDFYKTGLSLSNYWELPRKLVFSLQGKLNYADGLRGKKLPFYERYRLGGPHSIRGYRDYSIGPVGEDGDNLGGNKSMQVSAELQIPIAQPLKFVLFVDAGDTWAAGDDIDVRTLRPSTGFEVRFFMPGFGIPLRFIWGYNLDPYENENKNDFQFTMGRSF